VLLLASVWGCGESAARRLVSDLKDGDLKTQKNAIRGLILSPQGTDEVVSALREASQADDIELRQLAVTALGEVAPDSNLAMDALFVALRDRNRTVQFSAASSLLEIDSAIEAARQIILSEIRRVNPHALILVGEMGPDASWATPALRELLHHRDEPVRELARHALERVAAK
jgi:HEAT repeat protein